MTRTVVITGVAGGIGSAAAVAFHGAGWTVSGIDLVDPPEGTPVDQFARLDLASADVGAGLTALISGFSELDALVNAAAIQGTDSIDDSDVASWDAVLDANARGTFLAMRAAHHHLQLTRGAVVNIASVHALATAPGAAPYAASKGAIVAMTRAAAIEWAPEVRVNAVLPGAVDTQMLRHGMLRGTSTDVEAAITGLSSRIPLGRIGRPEEIAQAILFLAEADRSSFITGQTLVVDGGAIARLSTE